MSLTARLIPEVERTTVTLQPGYYTLNGLLVKIIEPTQVIYCEQEYVPEYLTKYPALQHSHNGGKDKFSKFNTGK